MWDKLLDALGSFLDVLYPAFVGKRGAKIFVILLIILFCLYLLA